MKTQQSGFTLIEIAIVLVIIGLLLGGVLKGQELITSARVRNMISQQDGIKAAYFGFLDRYRALPGDYAAASSNIKGVAAAAEMGMAMAKLRPPTVQMPNISGLGPPQQGGFHHQEVITYCSCMKQS